MELTYVLEIAAIIAIIAFIVMVGFLITLMRTASKMLSDSGKSLEIISNTVSTSMMKIDKDINDLKSELVDSLGVINLAMIKATDTIGTIHSEMDKVSAVTDAFQGLAAKVYTIIAPPINKTALIVSALTKGASVFKNIINKKK